MHNRCKSSNSSPVATLSGIDAPPSSVTVLDVAREAGVSPSTVSRILNGTARVTSDKRSAVEEAIRKLDFRPNLFARGLMTREALDEVLRPEVLTRPRPLPTRANV